MILFQLRYFPRDAALKHAVLINDGIETQVSILQASPLCTTAHGARHNLLIMSKVCCLVLVMRMVPSYPQCAIIYLSTDENNSTERTQP